MRTFRFAHCCSWATCTVLGLRHACRLCTGHCWMARCDILPCVGVFHATSWSPRGPTPPSPWVQPTPHSTLAPSPRAIMHGELSMYKAGGQMSLSRGPSQWGGVKALQNPGSLQGSGEVRSPCIAAEPHANAHITIQHAAAAAKVTHPVLALKIPRSPSPTLVTPERMHCTHCCLAPGRLSLVKAALLLCMAAAASTGSMNPPGRGAWQAAPQPLAHDGAARSLAQLPAAAANTQEPNRTAYKSCAAFYNMDATKYANLTWPEDAPGQLATCELVRMPCALLESLANACMRTSLTLAFVLHPGKPIRQPARAIASAVRQLARVLGVPALHACLVGVHCWVHAGMGLRARLFSLGWLLHCS